MSWKKLFKKFQSCLVHDNHLYLSGMKEAFLSRSWPDTSNELSTHEGILFGGRCYFKSIRIAVRLIDVV